MDVMKLLQIASKLALPEIVSDVIDAVTKIKDTAHESGEVIDHADLADLDAIHAEAVAAGEQLDRDLADAEKK